jgi:hypothetical protein
MRIQDIIQEAISISPQSDKAKAWIKKVYDKYPQTWQNNHVMPMGGTGNDQQFAMFELEPSLSKRDAVEVKWFQAYPLRQGVGSRAMKELQSLAREDGIALTLYPWDKGQVSQAKLTKFYKGQGFKPTAKGAKNMAWEPVEEAAGVGKIPQNGKEAKDPRYANALTVDIRPGQDRKEAAKWGFKIGKNGPPKLRSDGKA